MKTENKKILRIENAKIFIKDFASNNTYHYGPVFYIRIDGRRVKKMMKEGWVIKETSIKDKKAWIMPISVTSREDSIPVKPVVYVNIDNGEDNVINKNVFILTHNGLKVLDMVTINSANLVIHGVRWKINHPYEKTGIKAYLKLGVFNINPKVDASEIIKTINY